MLDRSDRQTIKAPTKDWHQRSARDSPSIGRHLEHNFRCPHKFRLQPLKAYLIVSGSVLSRNPRWASIVFRDTIVGKVKHCQVDSAAAEISNVSFFDVNGCCAEIFGATAKAHLWPRAAYRKECLSPNAGARHNFLTARNKRLICQSGHPVLGPTSAPFELLKCSLHGVLANPKTGLLPERLRHTKCRPVAKKTNKKSTVKRASCPRVFASTVVAQRIDKACKR